MKKIFGIILLVVIASCSKNKDMQKLSEKISGEWELEKFIGYPQNQDYTAGSGEIIVFRKNGSFERLQQNVEIFSGQFYLVNKKDCGASTEEIFFTTNDSSFTWDSKIRIENEKLLLESSVCVADGGVSIYRKLKDVD